MYSNIGGKIMGLAAAIMTIGTLACIIIGANTISQGNDTTVTIGWVILIGGPIFMLIESFVLYGFGVLIDKVQDIHSILSRNHPKAATRNDSEESADVDIFDESIETRETWTCRKCGSVNAISKKRCEVCGRHRFLS